MQLSREAYVLALKSPIITLVVGDTGITFPCAMAFLALHSEYFAKLLSNPGALQESGHRLQLQNVSPDSVACFVHWCYQSQPLTFDLQEHAAVEELKANKDMLVDLWTFADEHSIGRLQNEAMDRLRDLLGTHPLLLTKDDIFSIFSRTSQPQSALRRLAIAILVAQLHTPSTTTKIEDFDELLFGGVIPLFYKAMRNWAIFSPSKTSREDMLLALLNNLQMVQLLNVKENEPEEWVLALCGIAPKTAASGVMNEPIEID